MVTIIQFFLEEVASTRNTLQITRKLYRGEWQIITLHIKLSHLKLAQSYLIYPSPLRKTFCHCFPCFIPVYLVSCAKSLPASVHKICVFLWTMEGSLIREEPVEGACGMLIQTAATHKPSNEDSVLSTPMEPSERTIQHQLCSAHIMLPLGT